MKRHDDDIHWGQSKDLRPTFQLGRERTHKRMCRAALVAIAATGTNGSLSCLSGHCCLLFSRQVRLSSLPGNYDETLRRCQRRHPSRHHLLRRRPVEYVLLRRDSPRGCVAKILHVFESFLLSYALDLLGNAADGSFSTY